MNSANAGELESGPTEHDRGAVGQWAPNRFERLAAHHQDVARRHLLEPLEILGQMPWDGVPSADHPVLAHGRNGLKMFHCHLGAGCWMLDADVLSNPQSSILN